MPYVDTSPDLGGQNVILKTFEIAIRHNRQMTRTELSFLPMDLFSLTLTNILALLRGGGRLPPIDATLFCSLH